MARTTEQILKEIIGSQVVQIAQLQAQIESLSEQLAAALKPTSDS